AAIDEVERLATEAGARTVRLAVAGGFHTALMQPAGAGLGQALAGVMLGGMRVPVWANGTGQPWGGAGGKGVLGRPGGGRGRWEETMRGLLASGVEKFFEIGPGRVLAGLLKRVLRKADCTNVQA